MFDLIIIGAGPAGLACAIDAQKAHLRYLIVDKGCIVNSIYHYPEGMDFFSTSELLEIGNIPFTSPLSKPKREEAIEYYRRVVRHYELNLRQYHTVIDVRRKKNTFEVVSRDRLGREHHDQTRNVVFATGFYDHPNRLNVEGEDLPHVFHYYRSPHPFFGSEVVVIGAGNSATQVALDLYRHDANVTLVHRGADFSRGVKYWIRPDIENRVKNREIRAFFETRVIKIEPDHIHLKQNSRRIVLKADFIFAMTGYHPDMSLLTQLGVTLKPENDAPHINEVTHETNVPGVYVCGSIVAGRDTNKIFIENGRFHGETIVGSILRSTPKR
ncbi:MAG: YpdA family putative bacillithiol disulfide reductase [Gemmatimonadetes bacterium]|nr:MAG: YpdA family putative bacillithiol disulfide reductase [Gemmatimonadota bacterium]